MKKNFKLLSLIAISSALCFGVTALSIASPSIFKPLEFQERNAVVNSSVTFSNFSNCTGGCESVKSLANGGTIRAFNNGSHSNHDAVMNSSRYVFFEYVDNGVENDSITIGGTARQMAQFQSLSSIRVTYSGTAYCTVYYSNDGSTWSSADVTSTISNSKVAGARYIYLAPRESSGSTYVSEVYLGYVCDTEGGGDDPEPQAGLSGEYKFTNMGSVVAMFNFDGTLNATYTSYSPSTASVGLKYEYTDSSITFTLVSGNNDDLGSYKLFNGSATTATGTLGADFIKIYTYGSFNRERTFTKA